MSDANPMRQSNANNKTMQAAGAAIFEGISGIKMRYRIFQFCNIIYNEIFIYAGRRFQHDAHWNLSHFFCNRTPNVAQNGKCNLMAAAGCNNTEQSFENDTCCGNSGPNQCTMYRCCTCETSLASMAAVK